MYDEEDGRYLSLGLENQDGEFFGKDPAEIEAEQRKKEERRRKRNEIDEPLPELNKIYRGKVCQVFS
jgi:hypothetical protein